jgi:hypothetical protein
MVENVAKVSVAFETRKFREKIPKIFPKITIAALLKVNIFIQSENSTSGPPMLIQINILSFAEHLSVFQWSVQQKILETTAPYRFSCSCS